MRWCLTVSEMKALGLREGTGRERGKERGKSLDKKGKGMRRGERGDEGREKGAVIGKRERGERTRNTDTDLDHGVERGDPDHGAETGRGVNINTDSEVAQETDTKPVYSS